jgi:signal transduction histidine kinase
MKLKSLHARFVAGALFWTAGLLSAAIAIAITVVTRYPHSALIVHDGLLAMGGAVLVTTGLSVIRRGLSPVSMLRDRLGDIRAGRTNRLDGDYPSEVAPLVDDLNGLLEDRERRVARAAARAGDLAHGLKTPLAILAQEIARAEAAGQHELAASIRQQVTRMRRQIESHLAQARAAAGGVSATARTHVAEAVAGLVRTMERLHADRLPSIRSSVPPDCVVRVPLEDLEEIVGNLLDNACKWTRTRIIVSVQSESGRVTIAVDDDGAGLEPAMRQRVLQRGVRADEEAPGSGLGLAIVRDLAEAYGGTIALEQSTSLGGVSARLTLPA